MNAVVSFVAVSVPDSVSVMCDQDDHVVPAHQVDDIDEVHELGPVHQVDHKDEHGSILVVFGSKSVVFASTSFVFASKSIVFVVLRRNCLFLCRSRSFFGRSWPFLYFCVVLGRCYFLIAFSTSFCASVIVHPVLFLVQFTQ